MTETNDSTPLSYGLEADSQAKLRLSLRYRLASDSAKPIGLIKVQGRSARRKVVKDIGELDTGTDANPLAKLEVFGKGQVRVPDHRRAQAIVASATRVHAKNAPAKTGVDCGRIGEHV